MSSVESQLIDTRHAFDSVATDYDGPAGNNALIRHMRHALWNEIETLVPPGTRLLDLGCGTGLDAAYFGERGYRVVAIDWSPRMVERTRARIRDAGLGESVVARVIGIHEMDQLDGEKFACVYSDLGPLNCVPNLTTVARACANLLEPGGMMIASVIGRRCPWEALYFLSRFNPERARRRSRQGAVPVGLNGQTVWTRYFTPREFFREFAVQFELVRYRALGLFLPPPYLIHAYDRYRTLCTPLEWLDERLTWLPIVREAGDHFLITMRKREGVKA